MKIGTGRVWFFYCLLGSAGNFAARADGPPEVRVCRPTVLQITEHQDFNGRIEAAADVEIHARVTSIIERVHFEEGSLVRRGDLLFQLDSRIFQAKLDKARAERQRSEAHITRTASDLRRGEALLRSRAGSGEELEHLRGELYEAKAQLAIAQAGLALAELELDSTRICSPMDGRIGAAKFSAGALVVADSSVLTRVVTVDPMYAEWSIDQKTLLRLLRARRDGLTKAGDQFVEVGLSDDDGRPLRGTLNFLDNHINRDTGAVQARCTLSNAGGLLTPGMFARVRMQFGAAQARLAVPESAVGAKNGRRFVLIVNSANMIETRPVALGELCEGMRVLTSGATANDLVAVQASDAVKLHGVVNPVATVKPQEAKTSTIGY